MISRGNPWKSLPGLYRSFSSRLSLMVIAARYSNTSHALSSMGEILGAEVCAAYLSLPGCPHIFVE